MARQIEVDDEVFAVLKREAEPFVDTPNSVLRRLLNLQGMGVEVTGSPAKQRGDGPKGRVRRGESSSARRSKRSTERRRAPKGVLLPETEYELPILQTLDELGGKVPASEVLAALEPKIKERLRPLDLQPLDGSGLVRWKNRAQFCRLKLVQKGDLSTNSPRGVWEITDQGRKRIATSEGTS